MTPRCLLFALLAGTASLCAQPDETFQGNGLFSLPRSQDDIYEWRTAREEAQQGKVAEAVERLHNLLVARRNGVIPLPEAIDRYLGQRSAVIATLRDLPPEGIAAYERLTAREAGGLLRTAFVGSKPAELRALAQGFPTSEPGRRARLRLAAMAMESGDIQAAVHHYLNALDATPPAHATYQAIDKQLQLARALAQGSRTQQPLSGDVRELVDRALTSLPALDSSREFIDFFGGGRRPPRPPRGQPRLRQSFPVELLGYSGNDFSVHAVGGSHGVFVTDGLRITAFDALAQRVVWEGDGPFVRENEDRNEYEGQINPNSALAPAISDDVVVASLLRPSEGENARVRAFDVMLKIPVRRLVAFDRATGKQRWTHYDTKNGPIARKYHGHDACSAPLIAGDTVYVATHDQSGSIAYYLAAYTLATGELRWRRLICSSQLEVNMFGNARFEFAAAPLTLEGGILYGCTNLGVCFAANQADGELRWISAYEVTRMPPTRLTHQDERPVYFANNPPAVTDGVVAVAPLDSEFALGFDIEGGRMLWRLHHSARQQEDHNIRWLLGAIGDEFIFSGSGVLAVKARAPRTNLQPAVRTVRSRDNLGVDPIVDLPPRGAIVDDKIYYPGLDGISVFDKHGTADQSAARLPRLQRPGNLLLSDGLIASARRGAVDVYFDLDELSTAAEREFREHRDDPAAALRLAHLLGAQATLNVEGPAAERAGEVLRAGLAAAKARGISDQSAIVRDLAGQLFDLALSRADSLGKRDVERALALLVVARDGAPSDERWLEAQRRVLGLTRKPADQLRELQLLAERLGDKTIRVEGNKDLPAEAYVLWKSAGLEADPGKSVVNWQLLLERYPSVTLDKGTARETAKGEIERAIAQHGATVYRAVEERAVAALRAAAGDSRALTDLIERFPHSRAATDAVRALMDLAIKEGDLAAAARSFRHALVDPSAAPGLMRRLLEAARARGNLPLANALTTRLRRDFARVNSDFPGDAGKPYGDLAAPASVPAPAPLPVPLLPTHRVHTWRPLVAGNRLQLLACEPVPGFAAVDPPVLIWESGSVLRAEEPDPRGESEPRFTLDCPRLLAYAPLLTCSKTLLLTEGDRIRGVNLEDGRVVWSHTAEPERTLYSIGVLDGLLHVYDEHGGAGDGGRMLGLEPLTGAVVYARQFGAQEVSLRPVSTGRDLWTLRPDAGDLRILHLDRLDPTTGATVQRVRLPDAARTALGLPEGFAVQGMLTQVTSQMLADETTLYLPGDGVSDDPSRPATVVALRRDGQVAWVWRGSERRALVALWLRGQTLAVLESGPQIGAQLVLLDVTNQGRERQRIPDLGGSPIVLAPARGGTRAPGDDVLMLAGANRKDWSILGRSLTGDTPAFRSRIAGEFIAPQEQAVIGRDFAIVAAAVVSESDSNLHVFDFATGSERRIRLPDVAAIGLRPLGTRIVLETTDGIILLGERGTPLR